MARGKSGIDETAYATSKTCRAAASKQKTEQRRIPIAPNHPVRGWSGMRIALLLRETMPPNTLVFGGVRAGNLTLRVYPHPKSRKAQPCHSSTRARYPPNEILPATTHPSDILSVQTNIP